MTFGRTQLGELELMQAAFSGFNYPPAVRSIALLSSGAGAGNAVLQSSGHGFRQASLAWLAPSADEKDDARAYYEASTAIPYTDHNGDTTLVRILEFSSQLRVGDYWDCTATLIEADESEPAPVLTTLTDFGQGGWTEATRPNAVYDAATARSFIGWMNGDNGNVEIASFNHITGTPGTPTVLHAALEIDTHDAPALLIRASDKRVMAFYSRHLGDTVYMRISTNPLDVSAFDPEVSLHAQLGAGGTYTYMQPVQLANGDIWLFYRDYLSGTNTARWAYSISSDGGTTWSAQQLVVTRTGKWPYAWVWESGGTRIDLVTTDAGPQDDIDLKTYHTYWEAGVWHHTDGSTVVATLPFQPSDLTLAFTPSSGLAAWPWSILRDASGNPVILEQVIYPTPFNSIRRVVWDGSAWVAREIVEVDIDPLTAGGAAVGAGAGYSPGAVLDPDDPDVAYVCEMVDGVFEVIRRTTTNGLTWTADPVSTGSTEHCRYPFSPPGNGFDVLFLRGPYTSYLDNDVAVVGAKI